LAFLPEWKKYNDGKDVILTIINVNTRKAYAYALTSKRSDYIVESLKDFLNKENVNAFITDLGSEFTNNKVKDVFKYNKYNNIEFVNFEEEEHQKSGIIERFNRTLKLMLNEYMKANGNNTIHSSIGMKPVEIDNEKEEKYIFEKRRGTTKIKTSNLMIGDKGRILRKRERFEKEGTIWSKSIYTIIRKAPLSYILENSKGEKLNGRFKNWELQKN